MKLYFTPGACSLASIIALRECEVSFVMERVDLKTKQTEDGDDFFTVNPKGYVPALQTEHGVLTENVAVLQYIADINPQRKLAPPKESFERYRLAEWLAFISSEVHKSFKPFFMPDANDLEKQHAVDKLRQRLDYLEKSLDGNTFLMGENFGVADAYLYTVLIWLPKTGLDLAQWPTTQRYHRRIAERSSVQEAHKAEKAG
ncbi:MAG TPA: glutathione transferase GstA [Burkholderiales bacterium]|nr:glutathione transferase GstA [Burkholderiales bacterium]